MNIRVNNFEIEIAEGGHPVWIKVSRTTGGMPLHLGTFDHRQLRDLQYAVERAIVAARASLPDSRKSEMD